MIGKLIGACVGLAMMGVAGAVGAATISLTAQDQGWYRNTGLHNGTSSDDYSVGASSSSGIEWRNYFVFDLSGVTDAITSASLDLFNPAGANQGYVSSDASETYQVSDFTGSIAALSAGTGGTSAFNDLGTGTIYGSRTVLSTEVGQIVSTTLNASAIGALNSATGLFALGGSLTSLSSGLEGVFFNSSGSGQQTLTLETVPIPAALPLMGTGLAVLSFLGWRRSRAMQAA